MGVHKLCPPSRECLDTPVHLVSSSRDIHPMDTINKLLLMLIITHNPTPTLGGSTNPRTHFSLCTLNGDRMPNQCVLNPSVLPPLTQTCQNQLPIGIIHLHLPSMQTRIVPDPWQQRTHPPADRRGHISLALELGRRDLICLELRRRGGSCRRGMMSGPCH